MIFLICAIIGIVIAVVWYCAEWGFDGDCIIRALLGGALGVALAVILWLAIDLSNPAAIVVETEVASISALADNARYSGYASGNVFLVQSRVDETLKYSYMYKAENKGYGFQEVDADHCYINYTDADPYVEINKYDYKSGFLRWLLPNLSCNEYIFYIPNTAQIIDDYIIDFN